MVFTRDIRSWVTGGGLLLIVATSVDCASLGGAGDLATVQPPRTITLPCGDTYIRIPFEQHVILEIPPNDCWSAWAALPDQVTRVHVNSDGVLDAQVAFADGKTTSYADLLPTRRVPDMEHATGMRYRNKQKGVARVEIILQ